MIVTVPGRSGLTNAYTSVLSAAGSSPMSGASRWLEAAAPLGPTAPPSAATTTVAATTIPTARSSTPLFMPFSFLRLTEVGRGSQRAAIRFATFRSVQPDQSVVWITTRTIRPGSYEEFRKAWRPGSFPEGMIRAYECFSEDRSEVVGISWWDSFESRERYRLSEVEAERQRAMAPFVEAESSGLYVGRELDIPKD